MATLHIRYEGQSYDAALSDFDIGDLSTDAQIRSAAATHLGTAETKFANFSIDRNAETGDVTLRPQAVFG
jgi:HEAT repeat protein